MNSPEQTIIQITKDSPLTAENIAGGVIVGIIVAAIVYLIKLDKKG